MQLHFLNTTGHLRLSLREFFNLVSRASIAYWMAMVFEP